jgi:hypothetical protein
MIQEMTCRRRIHVPQPFSPPNQSVETHSRIFPFRIRLYLLGQRLNLGLCQNRPASKQNSQSNRNARRTAQIAKLCI